VQKVPEVIMAKSIGIDLKDNPQGRLLISSKKKACKKGKCSKWKGGKCICCRDWIIDHLKFANI